MTGGVSTIRLWVSRSKMWAESLALYRVCRWNTLHLLDLDHVFSGMVTKRNSWIRRFVSDTVTNLIASRFYRTRRTTRVSVRHQVSSRSEHAYTRKVKAASSSQPLVQQQKRGPYKRIEAGNPLPVRLTLPVDVKLPVPITEPPPIVGLSHILIPELSKAELQMLKQYPVVKRSQSRRYEGYQR